MPYLSEDEVAGLLSPADAVEAAEAALLRAHRGLVTVGEESGVGLDGGRLAVTPTVDLELGIGIATATASFRREGSRSVAIATSAEEPVLLGLVEIDRIRRLAAGAVAAVAARRLARSAAGSVGLLGSGALAAATLEALRACGLAREQVLVYSRAETPLAAFAAAYGAEPAEYGRDVACCDVVVAATTSPDPVLRGEWLGPGALVVAAGALEPGARELDNVVLRRSAFVCCDSLARARASADLAEPVEQGLLDWLEVHELGAVVAGELEGRQADDDIVLVKLTGASAVVLALVNLALERAGAR